MRSLSLSRFDCVFFDFDGVIADSVDAKINAFGELYREFGEAVRLAVMAYQRAVPGETRFDKIPKFHRELLGATLSPEEVLAWCDKLSGIVLDEVVASKLLPDVPEILALLRTHGIAAHIVSGTPEGELRVIVDRKGLRPFFDSARGAPRKKQAIVEEIIGTEGLVRERCLFVGDAMTDYDCAQACGIAFLGVKTHGQSPFPTGTPAVDRLGEALLPKGKARRAA